MMRKLIVLVSVLVFLGSMGSSAQEPQRLEINLASDGLLRWDRGDTPNLLIKPRRGDGWISIAQRYCGDKNFARRIQKANGGLDHPLRDRRLAIPLDTLRADLRLKCVQRLFPADQRVAAGYQHWVLDPFGGGEESWSWLARLYTGLEAKSAEIKKFNPAMAKSGLRRGRSIVIPAATLFPVFERLEIVHQPAPTKTAIPSPTPSKTPLPTVTAIPSAIATRVVGSNGVLDYGRDQRGGFAIYKLRQGEALYSAVVVRFTGQLLADEVKATAWEIARRSGIDDVTSIPIGYPVKIPLDLILPEYLPSDHPRRREWLAEQKELARFLEVIEAADLSGVHVIVDAGHGGKDSGAAVKGLWEATYAYDIACRIKHNLERHTRAEVSMTRKDEKFGFNNPQANRLTQHRGQVLLTHPRYLLGTSKIGVHLRWCLGNDVVRRQSAKGVSRSKFIFLSVHADSLHHSVRGAMIYVPSRQLREAKYDFKKDGMAKYEEYRNNRRVDLSGRFRGTAEASSRHLANQILKSLRENEVEIHAHEPIRDRVIKGRQRYVPAVLKYSTAQHAILVECCNLSNTDDRAKIENLAWREVFARSVVEGMAAAFAGK